MQGRRTGALTLSLVSPFPWNSTFVPNLAPRCCQVCRARLIPQAGLNMLIFAVSSWSWGVQDCQARELLPYREPGSVDLVAGGLRSNAALQHISSG